MLLNLNPNALQHPTEQESGPLQLPEIEVATLETVNPETVIQVQVVPVRLSNAVCTVEVNGLPASTSLEDIPPPKVSLDFSFTNKGTLMRFCSLTTMLHHHMKWQLKPLNYPLMRKFS